MGDRTGPTHPDTVLPSVVEERAQHLHAAYRPPTATGRAVVAPPRHGLPSAGGPPLGQVASPDFDRTPRESPQVGEYPPPARFEPFAPRRDAARAAEPRHDGGSFFPERGPEGPTAGDTVEPVAGSERPARFHPPPDDVPLHGAGPYRVEPPEVPKPTREPCPLTGSGESTDPAMPVTSLWEPRQKRFGAAEPADSGPVRPIPEPWDFRPLDPGFAYLTPSEDVRSPAPNRDDWAGAVDRYGRPWSAGHPEVSSLTSTSHRSAPLTDLETMPLPRQATSAQRPWSAAADPDTPPEPSWRASWPPRAQVGGGESWRRTEDPPSTATDSPAGDQPGPAGRPATSGGWQPLNGERLADTGESPAVPGRNATGERPVVGGPPAGRAGWRGGATGESRTFDRYGDDAETTRPVAANSWDTGERPVEPVPGVAPAAPELPRAVRSIWEPTWSSIAGSAEPPAAGAGASGQFGTATSPEAGTVNGASWPAEHARSTDAAPTPGAGDLGPDHATYRDSQPSSDADQAPGDQHDGQQDCALDGKPAALHEFLELAGGGPVVPELGLPVPGLAEIDSGEDCPKLAQLRREAAGEGVERPVDPDTAKPDPGVNGTAFGLLAELPAVTRPVRTPDGPVPALPQRVPAAPDVPAVPAGLPITGPLGEVRPAETPEIERIASYLREGTAAGAGRPDGFDIPGVLDAVRDFPGVRHAQLRVDSDGMHRLRLDLADDADPAFVSREIARLLRERMGLAAEPSDPPTGAADGAGPPREQRRRHPVPATRRPDPGRATESGGRAAEPARFGRIQQDARRAAEMAAAAQRASIAAGEAHRQADSDRQRGQAAARAAGDSSWQAPRQYDAARGTAQVVVPPAVAPPTVGATTPPAPAGSGVLTLDRLDVRTQGLETTVEVWLRGPGGTATGLASGPAIDGYALRLAAVAAGSALDRMLLDPAGNPRGRCFIEHASVVRFGSCEVAVVVLLVVCGGTVDRLTGSSLVTGDPKPAMARATVAAVLQQCGGLLLGQVDPEFRGDGGRTAAAEGKMLA